MSYTTGIPELDMQIRACTKTFGEDFFGETYDDAEPITTGSIGLDAALIIGGIPRGRINEILGEEGSGKTSLSFQIASEYQKQQASLPGHEHRRILVIDLEHTITVPFMKGFGINTDMVIHVRPKTVEQALTLARDLPKTGAIGMVIFDSVAAGQTVKQMQRDIGASDVGGISKLMHESVRGISKIAPETDTTYIFINQITYNPGVMFGSPETSPGGKALAYYASLRLKLMRGKSHKSVPAAMLMRVKIIKTKVAPPLYKDAVEIAFLYGKGPDPVQDVMSSASEYKLLRHAGKTNKVRWTLDGEEEKLPCEKKDGCYTYLKENPEILEKLRAATIAVALATAENVAATEEQTE